jgi:Fe-S oxidoreductase
VKHAADIIADTASCAYCPTLCQHACPVVFGEATDTVTPQAKMSLARWMAQGRARIDAESASVLHACTGCGACTDACRHHVDVPGVLQLAREACVDEGVTPHPAPEVPIETDDQAIMPPGVSGIELWAAGYRDRFVQVARAAVRRWARRSELVFASAADARCVRGLYPELGIEVDRPVVLASERVGARTSERVQGRVAYFEACHIARGGADAEMIRGNAERLAPDGGFVALRWRGETATCCGGSGVWKSRDPEAATRAAERILDSAVLHGATTLVVGCLGCARHLGQATGDRDLVVRSIGTGDEP